jgi:hypothetical protein
VPNISISNKLSSLSTRLRGSTVPIFSPATLFAAGEEGAWFDDDPATKFLDTTGTTLAGLTQSVALELEKSRGLELGPEIVTNGDFSDGTTGWSVGSGWSISGGAASYNRSSGDTTLRQSGYAPNKYYQVEFDLISRFGDINPFAIYFGDGIIVREPRITLIPGVLGRYSGILFSNQFSQLVFRGGQDSGSFGGTIDNVSVRELRGNHALQTSATFRPTRQTDGILYDGSDDRQVTPYRPTVAGSIIARFNGATASRVVLGSQAATDGRAFLGLDASGRLAAGIGAQGTAVIRDLEADRRNLLTHTEDFSNSVWVKFGALVTANDAIAPNGTLTADKVVFIAVDRSIIQSLSVSSAVYTSSVWVKGIAGETIRISNMTGVGVNHVLTGDWDRVSVTGTTTTSAQVAISTFSGATAREIFVWGAQLEASSTATEYQPILGAALNDLRNTFHTGAVTWDGTTVKLYLDGAEVYSAAQDGAVNTTVDMFKGALNANGTAAGFWNGRIEHAIALDRVLTPAEITNITAFWS